MDALMINRNMRCIETQGTYRNISCHLRLIET